MQVFGLVEYMYMLFEWNTNSLQTRISVWVRGFGLVSGSRDSLIMATLPQICYSASVSQIETAGGFFQIDLPLWCLGREQ